MTYPPKPVYELRLKVASSTNWSLSIYQLPSPATPRLKEPEHVGTLQGAALRLVEMRVLKRLLKEKIQLGALKPGKARKWPLDEETALHLGLLFRVLAPMKNADRIREVADGVEAMGKEEAGYWMSMALHRPNPRRVLAALRLLLTSH
ncbi:MAG: hypothetical protein KatS3mg005_1868 [Bryobacteraceae bacterium]|nr:MAG: hypothetical protein KatS3mg005_1868 [Bryobacteraceae bacterium]